MIIILYLSVALIAVAFFILVLSLSKTLKSLSKTLDNLSDTVKGLEGQLHGITMESTKLLEKTNVLVEDIEHKSERLNSVVYAVEDIGVSVQQLSQALRKVTTTIASAVSKRQDKIAQAMQWGAALKEIKNRWSDKKSKNSSGQDNSTVTHPLSAKSPKPKRLLEEQVHDEERQLRRARNS
ncbi:DUF948 domain-containing protein [Weizmannia acidilactici]|jgi:uncharacterized protein YoxC|uniref:DUF948 domain-containing protein n=1 Tax=Weizmannia acidilactici TaxID=2607726 RepID=UPI00124F37BE|nr:DUF948 domain-containing protein [Weizmannia acidilactici]GER66444.1 UPF0478 protein YtxG [Weizmannia acidilactici]GER72262.1 UPF0478 protein YtxG [Weizmannia acidilactici]